MIYDVTNEYLNKTTPIQVSVDKENRKPQKSNQVYLCIHNYYAWQPIAIGYRKENICYFDRVVGDNIFMVADSPDGNRLCFITAPFYIDEEGNIRKFIPQKRTHRNLHSINTEKTGSGTYIALLGTKQRQIRSIAIHQSNRYHTNIRSDTTRSLVVVYNSRKDL